MYRINRFIFPVIFFTVFGCKNFQEQALDDNSQIALPESAEMGVPAREFNKGMIFDFVGPINKWWVANDKVAIAKVGDTLRVDLKNCGQKYECWGTELDELIDFSKTPVLRVKARMIGGQVPQIGISLKDLDGYDTNMDRPSQRIQKSPEYQEYYFNFSGKWKQTWPDKKEVNSTSINELLFFVNPGQMNWTGTLFIDDIEAITLEEMPSEEELKRRRREARSKKEAQAGGTTTTTPAAPSESQSKPVEVAKEPEAPKVVQEPKQEIAKSLEVTPDAPAPAPAKDSVMANKMIETLKTDAANPGKRVIIDNFQGGISKWLVNNKSKITLSKSDAGLLVSLNAVGPGFENFGRLFSKIDFDETPVVKIRLKADGKQPGDLRLDIRDIDGFTTNGKPNVKVFKSGTDFVDYYFDFTGKFTQTYPNVKKVNASQIVEIVLSVNPGGRPYSGNLTISEVSAISLEELNSIK